eukprot:13768540-Ditylum_brightwellii.AAC.1
MNLELANLKLQICKDFAKSIHLVTEAFLTNIGNTSNDHKTVSTLLDNYHENLLLHICLFCNFETTYNSVHSLQRLPSINPQAVRVAIQQHN